MRYRLSRHLWLIASAVVGVAACGCDDSSSDEKDRAEEAVAVDDSTAQTDGAVSPACASLESTVSACLRADPRLTCLPVPGTASFDDWDSCCKAPNGISERTCRAEDDLCADLDATFARCVAQDTVPARCFSATERAWRDTCCGAGSHLYCS